MAEVLTFEELNAALMFDGEVLLWRVTRGAVRAWRRAGSKDKQGYIVLQYKGVYLLAHRVVWLLTRGEWPDGWLDHRDGNRSNNSPSNLRLATRTQNQRNRKGAGPHGLKGVTRHPGGRFQAQCDRVYLGLFDRAEDAGRAYDSEAIKRYGEFARLNFGGQS